MKRLAGITATLVFCASTISSANAQEEQFNVVPSSSASGISAEPTFTAPPQPGSILLLDGMDGTGKRALDKFGYTYTAVSAAGLASVNFNDFKIIYMPWYPYQSMVDALNSRKADLAKWISKGGGIVVNAEWKPDVRNPYSFLPVTFDTAAEGWYHGDGVHIIDPTHPLVEGLTDALLGNWGSSVHGKITVYPSEATVVTTATSFGSAHILGMCHQAGKIIVAANDPEWHIAYGGGDGPARFLYNELKWASIPCNHPPVADAGPNQSAIQREEVCFDGTSSSDADNDPLTYSWTLTSWPAGSTAELDNPTVDKPCLTTDLPGTYKVSLIVNDGTVDSAPSTAEAAVISYRDAINQLCPCEGPRDTAGNWKNHGGYVSCVAKSAESFLANGLITEAEKDEVCSEAGQSSCGGKK